MDHICSIAPQCGQQFAEAARAQTRERGYPRRHRRPDNIYDEYGNLLPRADPARYGWLGGKQRSSETPSRVTFMGVRLYDPTAGRFLSIDSIYGGNENSYVYFSRSGQ